MAALGRWRDDPRLVAAISAGQPREAHRAAARLVAAGPRVLLSWGIAGGLAPTPCPGTLVLSDGVVGPGGRPFAFDPSLLATCRAALPGVAVRGEALPDAAGGMAGAQLLAGVDAVQFTPVAKMALRRRTGAVAVDMESHALAEAARGAGIPCIALRAVSDPAHRRLPMLAASALDADGRPALRAVLRGIARRPWDLPALIAAGRDSRAALAALTEAAEALIPALLAAADATQFGD